MSDTEDKKDTKIKDTKTKTEKDGSKAKGATAGKSVETEPEMSAVELAFLEELFKKLGTKPKVGSAVELRKFMIDYLKTTIPEGMVTEASEDKEIETPEHKGDAIASTPTVAMATTSTTGTSVTTSSSLPFPRIDNFSGDTSLANKNETTYELWRYQIYGLINSGYPMCSVKNCIQRSLKGNAAKIAMRLGYDASVFDILEKFQAIYGSVDAKETILAEFYSARQRDDEDVSQWGCRLEDIINKAIHRGMMTRAEADEKLRAMFWEGLKMSLKDVCGYLNATIKDFDKLQVAVREIEYSHKKTAEMGKKSATSKMAVTSDSSSQYKELTAMINRLSTDMAQVKSEINNLQSRPQPQSSYNTYGSRQQQSYSDLNLRFGRGQRRYPRGYGYANQGSRNCPDTPMDRQPEDTGNQDLDGPVCYRCGQIGHMKIGCHVRLDHFNRGHLNQRRSTGRRGRR